VRVTASRFAESMQGGVSLISVGGFNQTSLNQAARCIMAFGQPKLLVFRGNRSLAELLPGAPCVEASKVVQASLGLGALQGAADPQEV
jgi:hypothetical protein